MDHDHRRPAAGPPQGGWHLDTPRQLSAIGHPSRVALQFYAGGYLIAQTTAQNPADACNSGRVLRDGLRQLEADMHQHVHKENNILFPRALEAESALAAAC